MIMPQGLNPEDQLVAELARRNQAAAVAGGQAAPSFQDPATGALSGGPAPAQATGISVADLLGLASSAGQGAKKAGGDFLKDLSLLLGSGK